MVWVISVIGAGGPALAVRSLGYTATSVTQDVVAWQGLCSRCYDQARATFRVQGQLVTADLRSVGQDQSYYRPGITIVYSRAHPELAMARADYDGDRSLLPVALIGVTTAVVFLGNWALVVTSVRRGRP
ncbi:MAG TPA: hypothetical protein VE990_13380 [Acidimicrobiales bacterium]|nr:hypothetical protein [Acidimicrobiales bacterium]